MSADQGLLFHVTCRPPLLVAAFAAEQLMLSWSLNRPGLVEAREVAFLEVKDKDLPPEVCPHALLADTLSAAGLPDAVGLMTARNIVRHHVAARRVEDAAASCLVTLGLNNGERVGSRLLPAPAEPALGTVNILAAVSMPLSPAALLEAQSVVVEARTLAILEAGYRREGQAAPVTGTGTDCVVVSAPRAQGERAYAGLHTAIGEALGAAVLAATRAAAAQWLADRAQGWPPVS